MHYFYNYIETGALMSNKKNVKNILIPSEEEHITMYPIDFEEFLWALDNHQLMDFIKLQKTSHIFSGFTS